MSSCEMVGYVFVYVYKLVDMCGHSAVCACVCCMFEKSECCVCVCVCVCKRVIVGAGLHRKGEEMMLHFFGEFQAVDALFPVEGEERVDVFICGGAVACMCVCCSLQKT